MKYYIVIIYFIVFSIVISCSTEVKQDNHDVSIIDRTKIQIYQTAKDNEDRLQKVSEEELKEIGQPLEQQACVFIDDAHEFQTLIGIGGAFTDASAEVFDKLPKEKQNELLKAYFDKKEGIGYTFTRTHIASCDFSRDSYDYIQEGDSALSTFSIDHDKIFRIPFIKRAMEIAGGFNLFVSPWSPPAWMKDNNNRLRGGKLLDKYKQSWASHYAKFIKAYEKEGIPVWGLSIQNEPMAKQPWESCIYTAEEERDFVKYYLGPTLEKSGLSSKKIIIWDHNRDLIYQRASTVLNDKVASKYVWGVGFHWYEGPGGKNMQFDNLKRVYESFPETHLVFTEGCCESYDIQRINDWSLGERYGLSMVNDFNNGTVAWTDWNILLDEKGGPNHVENFCFAPIHADLSKGELIYTNSYYYIGHFSKFIEPGAKRITCSTNRSGIQSTAFKNQDGSIAVVVLNTGDADIDYLLWINGMGTEIKSLGHSIQTIVL